MAEATALPRGREGALETPAAADAGPDALPPMPKRVADTSLSDLPPDEAIAKLMARAARLVEQLETDVADLAADQDKERQRIEAEWTELTAALESATARLAEMSDEAREIADRKARLDELERAMAAPASLDPGASFLDVASELDREIKLAHGITGAIRLPAIGRLLSQAGLAIKQLEAASEQTRQRLLSRSTETMHAEGTEARASFEIGMGVLERDLELLADTLPMPARSWTHSTWNDWSPPESPVPWLRVGEHVHDELTEIRVPAVVSTDDDTGLLFEPGAQRSEVIAGVQSMLLRIVAANPPGSVRFAVVDPKGVGDSVAPLLPLAEYDPDLLCGGVKTLEAEIEESLAELVRHIELVTKRYLQGRFETLTDYQESIGEVVEPTRYLVTFDHPAGLSEQGATLLRTVIDTGARAGVHAIIVKDPKPAYQPPATRKLPGLRVLKGKDGGIYTDTPWGAWKVDLDTLDRSDEASVALAERIVHETGRAARDLVVAPLTQARMYRSLSERQRRRTDEFDAAIATVEPEQPSTWWPGDAGDSVAIPLGATTEREPIIVDFNAHEPGLLIAGATAADLTQAIDSIVSGIAISYAPTEVQLLLLSFEARDGFKAYGEGGLPHARLVATDAERDLAVSLLETLDGEMDRRIDRFRAEGCERTGLRAYRAASGKRLSRIVLVIDRVGDLLRSGDRLAQRAERLLSRLALEGPPLGLHVVLSERLQRENLEVLVRTGDLFRTRLLLVDKLDSLTPLLPEGSLAGDFDEQPTTAVVVRSETCHAIRPVRMDRQDRASCLRELRHLADERGVVGRPQVMRGDMKANLENAPLALLSVGNSGGEHRLKPRLWVGEPVALGPPVEVVLRRERVNNLLVVGPVDMGEGVLLATATSAALAQGEYLDVRVVDFTPIEHGFGRVLAELDSQVDIKVARAQSIDRVLGEVVELTNGRRSTGDYRSRPVLVLLAGVNDWTEPETRAQLTTVLRDGPTVGVHVALWVDSAETCLGQLGREALKEFGYRIVGQMDHDDSTAMIESDAAASLKPAYGLLYDETRARLTKLRPYGTPRPGWQPALGRPARQAATSA